jgi:Domain of unknown function (DUF4126)
VDVLATLGRTLGFSFAAGVNLYATAAILGLASRYQWVDLPEQFRIFDNNWIIGAALAMYLVEFVADKIPWVDSVWDAVHTVIRPAGAALIAVASIGHARPAIQAAAALAGAALASSSHLAKAGTRLAANTSPEPFSNWMLSLSEDGFVVALAVLALKYPLAAAVVVITGVAIIIGSARWLFRRARHRMRRTAADDRWRP